MEDLIFTAASVELVRAHKGALPCPRTLSPSAPRVSCLLKCSRACQRSCTVAHAALEDVGGRVRVAHPALQPDLSAGGGSGSCSDNSSCGHRRSAVAVDAGGSARHLVTLRVLDEGGGGRQRAGAPPVTVLSVGSSLSPLHRGADPPLPLSLPPCLPCPFLHSIERLASTSALTLGLEDNPSTCEPQNP